MTTAKAASQLAMLRSLADSPAERRAYALRLMERQTEPELLRAALAALAEQPGPDLRPLLLERYAYLDAKGVRRDPGGTVRAAILHALRLLLHRDDAPLLERAATTYEFLYGEAAGDLRAAGLLALNKVDDYLAGYHCVRLLIDQYTSAMSGEPAVSAVRVLASQEQFLPLYEYAMRGEGGVSDVLAECLRHLVRLPPSLLPALLERHRESEDEIVLLGLFDLLLEHESRGEYMEFVFDFLSDTKLYNIYRYLASTLVAGHDERLIGRLRNLSSTERNPQKAEILREVLALRDARR